MEYEYPSYSSMPGTIQLGVAVEHLRTMPDRSDLISTNNPNLNRAISAMLSGEDASFLEASVFVSTTNKSTVHPIGGFMAGITRGEASFADGVALINIHKDLDIELRDSLEACIGVVMAAHQILGSGGVVAQVGGNPKQRVMRQARKRIGEPVFGWKHHTILVKPNHAKKNDKVYIDLNDEETMLPYHSVRAHYSTYTPDKPLFGKYVGRFYVPTHFRGEADNGVVTKDYKIVGHNNG